MTAKLQDQIREVGRYTDEVQGEITLTEVLERSVSVRPIPAAPPSTGWTRGVVIAAIGFAAIIALIVLPLWLRSSNEAPPATVPEDVSTTAGADGVTPTTAAGVEAPPITESPTTTAAIESVDAASYADWAWTPVDIPSVSVPWHLDGVYFLFESGQETLWEAGEGADTSNVDHGSYIWTSTDGVSWLRSPLPDLVDDPALWWYNEATGLAGVTVAGSGTLQYVDVVVSDGEVTFESTEQVERETVLNLPEVASSGLVPSGTAPIGYVNNVSTVASAGSLTVIEGTFGFELPEDIGNALPPSSQGESGPASGEAFSGWTTTGADENGELLYEVIWSVDGQRITVEVVLHTGPEPELIHTGWAELPDDILPISTGTYMESSTGYGADVLWISSDGGATYDAYQPEMLKDHDPFSPGRLIVGHDDRFLMYVEHASDEAWQVAVWSSTDGRGWNLETEDAGSFEVFNVAQASNALVAPSQFGLWQSEDGIQWAQVPSTQGWDQLTTRQSGFGAIGRSSVFLSSDGLEWFDIALPDDVAGLRVNEDYAIHFVGDVVWIKKFDSESVWIGRVATSR